MTRPCVRGAVVLALLVAPALAWAEGPQRATPNQTARAANAFAAAASHSCWSKRRLLAQGRPFVCQSSRAPPPRPAVPYWLGRRPCCRQLSRRDH